MTKEEATMVGFEIVAYSGDARTKLLLALEEAKKQNFEKCEAPQITDRITSGRSTWRRCRSWFYYRSCPGSFDDDDVIKRYYGYIS